MDRTEVLRKALEDIVIQEMDKIVDPNLSNKEKFQKVSGKAIARFKINFPNVEVLRFEENNGGFDLALCEHELH